MGDNKKKVLGNIMDALKVSSYILLEDSLGDSRSGMAHTVEELLERFPGIKAGEREPTEMEGFRTFDGGQTWVLVYKGIIVSSKHSGSYFGPKEIAELPSLYEVLRACAEKSRDNA